MLPENNWCVEVFYKHQFGFSTVYFNLGIFSKVCTHMQVDVFKLLL